MSGAETQARLSFTLNGQAVATEAPTSMTLADMLRHRFGLGGTKLACERAVCGACTVRLDGAPVAACGAFAFEADGAVIETIEGLADAVGSLDPIQSAFADLSAFQCGYCTSGMIMLTRALLAAEPDPDHATIVDWVSSNICRCTGYALIVEAVKEAAKRRRAAGHGA